MRAGLFLLVLLVAPAVAQEEPAPQIRELTYEEALDLGLAYNLGLKSSRIGALVARLSVNESDAAWDPVLTASVGGGETLSPSRSTLAGADVVDADSFNFTLGVNKQFRLGPSLGVTWRTDRSFTNSSFSTINPAYDTALEVTLTIPLLQGRGRKANEANLRMARASAEGAHLMLLDAAAGMIQSIAAACRAAAASAGRGDGAAFTKSHEWGTVLQPMATAYEALSAEVRQ